MILNDMYGNHKVETFSVPVLVVDVTNGGWKPIEIKTFAAGCTVQIMRFNIEGEGKYAQATNR